MLRIPLQRVPSLVRDASAGPLFLGYALLHGLVAAAGYLLAAPGAFFAAFWPAAGLLLAACIICRRRHRWILLVASITAELMVGLARARIESTGIGPGPILYVAVVQALAYGLSTVLVERWWKIPLPAGVSKLARGTAVVVLVLAGTIAVAAAGPAWYFDLPYLMVLQAWLGGLMLGSIAVTPAILAWWMSITGFRGEIVGSRLEFLILTLLALGTTWTVFGDWPTAARYQPIYIHFPLLLWAAMRFPPRYVALLGLGIACLTAALTSVGQGPFAADQGGILSTLLPLQLFIVTMILSALLLSVANYERYRSERSLRGYALALADAENRARRRTAADLHDGIGQELFGVRMRLGAARRSLTDRAALQVIDENLQALDTISKSSRHLIEELDPPWIYELDFAAAIKWLVERFLERAGLHIELRRHGESAELAVEDRALLFRSVRELLQNIVRHSGVSAASVDLRSTHEILEIVIEDAGCGFDVRFETPGELHGGFGLFSVREQLQARGAQLRIETRPGQGCRVTIVWPLGE